MEPLGAGILALLAMTGCPSGFGKDGRVDRAAHQDVLGIVRKVCTEETRREVCGGAKRNSQECRDTCGE
jgi:hypothetical protein